MIAVAIATLAAGLSLDGSVRSEARAGSTIGGQDPSSVGVTAELDGRASYPEGAVRFALAPSLALGAGHEVFVRGFGEGGLRIGRRASIRLREALGYGTVDLAPVTSGPALGPPRGPVQVPAGTRFVSVQESNTSLELEVPASRRLRF